MAAAVQVADSGAESPGQAVGDSVRQPPEGYECHTRCIVVDDDLALGVAVVERVVHVVLNSALRHNYRTTIFECQIALRLEHNA